MPNPTFVPVLRQGADVSFGTLTTTGNASIGGTLNVTGNVTLAAAIAVAGAATMSSTLAVTSTLTVGGNTDLQGLTVHGTASMAAILASATTVTQLTVSGTSTLTGAAALNGGGTWTGLLDGTGATAATSVFGTLVTGDTVDRLRVRADGQHDWGPGGGGARDTTLRRSAVGVLATDGSFSLATVGGGLLIKEGANGTSGVATLVAGTVVVSTTKVTATSRIQLTAQSLGTVTTPKALAVTARTAGTSFTITSADNTDTSPVAWTIIEPAP
jgi:hypothetical protein